jgi:hypothetical protein
MKKKSFNFFFLCFFFKIDVFILELFKNKLYDLFGQVWYGILTASSDKKIKKTLNGKRNNSNLIKSSINQELNLSINITRTLHQSSQ